MSTLHAASRDGNTKLVKQLLDTGAPVDEKDEYGNTALMLASEQGHTEVVKLLLDKGASVDEKKKKSGHTAPMVASRSGHTEVAKLLLDTMLKRLLEKSASLDEEDESGLTLLTQASWCGHTELVELLLDKMLKQLLDKGASLDEKDKHGRTLLIEASRCGYTKMVKLLLDKGASVDEKDEEGRTALMWASMEGHTEVVQLLLGEGARIDVRDRDGNTALPVLLDFDEDQLGRMAAAQVHRLLLKGQGSDAPATPAEAEAEAAVTEATAKAVLKLVRAAGLARARAHVLSYSDPRSADDHQVLFARLQLAAAACIQNDESGEVRAEEDVRKLLDSDDGRKALVHAVQIEAMELLAQRVVQKHVQLTWRGELEDLAKVFQLTRVGRLANTIGRLYGPFRWTIVFVILLLQLLFLLPLVALVPALDPWLTDNLKLEGVSLYLLRLPVVKFGLERAADLALALALTLIPAGLSPEAPGAKLLIVWVGSALLWEARQLMAPISSDAKSLRARMYDRLAAYWGDSMNRLDATALFVSLEALTVGWAPTSQTGDSEVRGAGGGDLGRAHGRGNGI